MNLDQAIVSLGKEIFQAVGKNTHSAFNKNYWMSQIMSWSMKRPDFKVNLFRLVDVLPTLRSDRAIVQHIKEYLGSVAEEVGGPLSWGIQAGQFSIARPLTGAVVRRSVKQMARMFIAGESPRAALPRLLALRKHGLAFTVDLLGEFCVSEKEADAYLARYLEVLDIFGQEIPRWSEAKPLLPRHPGEQNPICISVKLTALYSQCNPLNFDRSVEVLSARLSQIAARAHALGALMYVDAEDSANNAIIYEVFKRVFASSEFRTFPFPGIVLQAYHKESAAVLDDLLRFANERGNPIAVRLVKGAYWDYETVLSKQNGWESPLFSKKESSDAQFEKLTRVLLDNHHLALPAFGSHNIRSLSHACCYAAAQGIDNNAYELQMLYGMADPIAHAFRSRGNLVRLYVPIGNLIVGMGYLVRRLLENTSNESFLKHTFFDAREAEQLLAPPQLGE